MHFINKLTSLLIVALAGTAVSKPVQLNRRGEIDVGVRHMSKPEADAVIANGGKLVYDESKGNAGGELGKGIYVTTSTFEFMYGDWHTVVKVDEGTWDDLPKLYIPEKAKVTADGDEVNLLSDDANIRLYIQFLGMDPENTIRMKDGPGDDSWGQFLIPGGLAGTFSAAPQQGLEGIPDLKIKMSDWDEVEDNEEAEDDAEDDSDNEGDDNEDDGLFDFDDIIKN